MQFFHLRVPNFVPDSEGFSHYQRGIKARGGQTIAMQELTSWFVNSLQEGEFFVKSIGKSRCSDKENYNKKLGRELSSSRMEATKLTVNKVLIFSGTKEVELIDEQNNKYVVQSRIEDNSGNARFIKYISREK
jgi:hypothetical protein